MKIRMQKSAPGLALAGAALALSGCGSSDTLDKPKPQAAEVTFSVDESGSTALIGSPVYANAAIEHAAQAMMHMQLGDGGRITVFGDSRAENAVDLFSKKSGYKLRLPALRKQVEAALRDAIDKARASGGQAGTNILYSLETMHPTCTPRSKLVILSDGIAEDGSYSASKALAAGERIHLPRPGSAFLRGCQVEMIGIGMVSPIGGQSAQALPSDQLNRLIAGYREYLSAAGVVPHDVTFTTAL